jgi:hypothetical protein
VYEELRIMKLQKPWLQALKERDAGVVEEKKLLPQELVPKRMRDSYHELVSARLAHYARCARRRTLAEISV